MQADARLAAHGRRRSITGASTAYSCVLRSTFCVFEADDADHSPDRRHFSPLRDGRAAAGAAADRSLAEAANGKIIRHLEAGGVSLLLYGGNANFYHLPLPEYDAALSMLARLAGPDTLWCRRRARPMAC